jgi:predicted GIY-YIG superfamily endonuclease
MINILECFDDNIDNLDITKNYIYVLQLVEERYYVGRTGNIIRRIEEHFTGNGSIYTKQYKPLKVIEVEEEKTNEDERLKTLEIMEKYGWEKVRGACWCSLEITKPNIEKNKISKTKKIKKRIPHENDEKVKNLYCVNNEDIISIGEKLNIPPTLVAYTLEKLNIISRRQLARGYFDYIGSDLYKEAVERINKKREEKMENEIDINESKNDNIKIDLLNIKNIIREKYLRPTLV